MNPPQQQQQTANDAATPLINIPPQKSHGGGSKWILVVVLIAVLGLFAGIGWYVFNMYQAKQMGVSVQPTPQAAYTKTVVPTLTPAPTQTLDDKMNAVNVSSDDADLKAVQTDISGL